jgi:hypothetical protein
VTVSDKDDEKDKDAQKGYTPQTDPISVNMLVLFSLLNKAQIVAFC